MYLQEELERNGAPLSRGSRLPIAPPTLGEAK
jgi:hypothetical protein